MRTVAARRRPVQSRYRHWATNLTFAMKRRNFTGKVVTLADAVEADYLVFVECNRCRTRKQMHPYTILSKKHALASAPLDTPVAGFKCNRCRTSVWVTIHCTYRHPGDF